MLLEAFFAFILLIWLVDASMHSLDSDRYNLPSIGSKRLLSNTDTRLSPWGILKNISYDEKRPKYLASRIQEAVGVYNDRDKARKVGVLDTVLINVIAYEKQNNNLKYKSLLRNWKCYTDHYGLRPLLYLVPNHVASFNEQVKELEEQGFTGIFASYPLYMFWSLVDAKKSKIHTGTSRVDFSGSIPSFAHYGPLVMIVPILEILEAGYNVIYLDVDVVALRDPIPYLISGRSDIVVSLEARSCFAPSTRQVALATDWKALEPNTGILHIRSNNSTLRIVRRWIHKIVDGNVANDQKVFYFEHFGARLSFDCNPQLFSIQNELLKKYRDNLKKSYNIDTREDFSSYPRYCYLNEYLVQNGKILFQCAGLSRGDILTGEYMNPHMDAPAYPSEYVVAMKDMNFTVFNKTSMRDEETMLPALIHVNYCGDKIRELEKLGLWLPTRLSTDNNNKHLCRDYSVQNVLHSKIDWNLKIKAAREEIMNVSKILENGSVIKIRDVYFKKMVSNGSLRTIPNQETFKSLGLVQKQVRYVGAYNMVLSIPEGAEFPDTKKYKQ